MAVQGRCQPRTEVFLEWYLGRSFISNVGHVEGSSEGRFSFLIRLGLTFELPLGELWPLLVQVIVDLGQNPARQP